MQWIIRNNTAYLTNTTIFVYQNDKDMLWEVNNGIKVVGRFTNRKEAMSYAESLNK